MKPLSARRAAVKPTATARSVSINGVIVRSEVGRTGKEDAWVSVLVVDAEAALVNEFKAADWGDEAWSQAVKYGKRLAERLGNLTVRKRRAEGVG